MVDRTEDIVVVVVVVVVVVGTYMGQDSDSCIVGYYAFHLTQVVGCIGS